MYLILNIIKTKKKQKQNLHWQIAWGNQPIFLAANVFRRRGVDENVDMHIFRQLDKPNLIYQIITLCSPVLSLRGYRSQYLYY